MRWGLVPSWAKDISIGNRMINARAETLAERPSFRVAFRRRRCLVVADSFYEWKRDGRSRIPMRISLESGELFGFAGLWETWNSPDGRRILSCAIVTTAANEFMAPIHDRMPVILSQDAESDVAGSGRPRHRRAFGTADAVSVRANERIRSIERSKFGGE